MKLLNTALLLSISSSCSNAFNMNMNAGNGGAGRSKLSHQYKNIMSVHHGISGMAPPPGEPEPEVSFFILFGCVCVPCVCVLGGVLFGHDFVGLVFKRVGWLFLIDGRVMYDVLSHRIFCRRVLILYQTRLLGLLDQFLTLFRLVVVSWWRSSCV